MSDVHREGHGGDATPAPKATAAPDPVAEAQGGAEKAAEPTSNGHAPPSVLDTLRTQHAARTSDRRKVVMILPGRHRSMLAARYKPIPWNDQRRKVRKFQAQGDNEETELNYGAGVLVEACVEILVREAPGAPLKPMHEVVAEFEGDEPVRYDARLATALGIDPKGLDSVAICRLVFNNPSALNAHFAELDAWQREATEDDEDDADRPT